MFSQTGKSGCSGNPAPTIAFSNVAVSNVSIAFLPAATVKIRRFKYTPYNLQAIQAAIVQRNSWGANSLLEKEAKHMIRRHVRPEGAFINKDEEA